MKRVKVTVLGVTALLMNKPKEYEGDSNVKINNTAIETEQAIRDKVYTLDGVVYQPATHFWRSLINAGKDLQVKGKGKATYSKLFGSMVQVIPEAIEHKKQDFDVFITRVVNPSTKGMMMSKRPRLKEWELDFELLVEDEIPLDVLKEGLERAGKYVGVGDWRPEKKGIHGKFQVTSFQEAKLDK